MWTDRLVGSTTATSAQSVLPFQVLSLLFGATQAKEIREKEKSEPKRLSSKRRIPSSLPPISPLLSSPSLPPSLSLSHPLPTSLLSQRALPAGGCQPARWSQFSETLSRTTTRTQSDERGGGSDASNRDQSPRFANGK